MFCRLDERGRLIAADESWSRFGYVVDSLEGMHWSDLVHEDDRVRLDLALRRLPFDGSGEQGARVRTRDVRGVYGWTRWVFRRSSKTADAALSSDAQLASNELLPPEGAIEAMVFDARYENQDFEQYRLGVEAAPTGILMVDAQGTIMLVNRQIETMFGYDRSELLGESVEVLMPERFRGQHSHLRRRYLKQPSARTMGEGLARSLYGMRRDGTEFEIEIGLNPLVTDAGTRVLTSIVDVSSRVAQEDELRARVAELQRYQHEMDLLSEMSSLLQHALHQQEAHDIVAAFGKRLLSTVDVSIYALRASRDALELKSCWGRPTTQARLVPTDCWALRRTHMHRTGGPDDASMHVSPMCRHGETSEIAWQTCIPMSAHGQSTGLLSLSSLAEIDPAERRMIERVGNAIADQLALALSNIALHESLRALAIRDPLTGLFNRRYLEESAARELLRAERRDSPVAVAMIDIDHFKRYNDTHGHQSADDALASFAGLVSKSVRVDDIVCRFGGEEFVIVFPDCSRDDGLKRADLLRQKIDSAELGFTISIGVAEWPGDGRSWAAVLDRADQALYASKAAGRNRVTAASSILETVPGSPDRGELFHDR